MRRRTSHLSLFAIVAAAGLALGAASAQDLATEAGLVEAEGWELVYAHCSACHSLALVVAQRGDRETWLRLIRWMQATQNFWALDPQTETRILDYLSKHYPPDTIHRRAPLPPELMPRG